MGFGRAALWPPNPEVHARVPRNILVGVTQSKQTEPRQMCLVQSSYMIWMPRLARLTVASSRSGTRASTHVGPQGASLSIHLMAFDVQPGRRIVVNSHTSSRRDGRPEPCPSLMPGGCLVKPEPAWADFLRLR